MSRGRRSIGCAGKPSRHIELLSMDSSHSRRRCGSVDGRSMSKLTVLVSLWRLWRFADMTYARPCITTRGIVGNLASAGKASDSPPRSHHLLSALYHLPGIGKPEERRPNSAPAQRFAGHGLTQEDPGLLIRYDACQAADLDARRERKANPMPCLHWHRLPNEYRAS